MPTYSGTTIVDDTVDGSTRLTIATDIKDALVAAGWTIASSSTGDWKLDSETAPTSGTVMRVRVFDPGSGSCAKIRISNVGETTMPSNDVFLLPGTGKTFRIIANAYQAMVVVPGSVSTPRNFAFFSMPYVPTDLVGSITELGISMGNGYSDSDTTLRGSWRTFNLTSGTGNAFLNGNAWSCFGDSNGGGNIKFHCLCENASQVNTAGGIARWHDDSYVINEPLVSWGSTSYTSGVEGKIRGILWDALVTSAPLTADEEFTYDGHDWFVVTDNNTGVSRGTLCIAIT